MELIIALMTRVVCVQQLDSGTRRIRRQCLYVPLKPRGNVRPVSRSLENEQILDSLEPHK